jgi:hypothetical protein
MKLKIVVHEAEEGGFWAEVPEIPGCATQEKPSKNFSEICRRLSRAAYPLSYRQLGFRRMIEFLN